MRKGNGFTLIELLVVIAIIALLMAILMPALQRVKKQGKTVACLSLLKQWSLWFSMYAEEYNGYFMEGFDMMIDQDYAIAVYPRLTFGPGQRYASKGCYIVQLTPGPDAELVQKSEWVVH